MPDSTISLRVQQLGAEGVRTRLREINQELKAGAPVTKELRGEIRELSTQVRTTERVTRLSSQAWLENHRTLQSAGKVMQSVGSIARSTLAITTAFSVATSAFGKNGSQLAEAVSELGRAQRDLNSAMEGGDPEKIAEAQENVNVLTQRIKELKDQDLEAVSTNILNIGASLALLGSGAISVAGKFGHLLPAVSSMRIALTGLGAAGWIALGPLLLIAAAVAGIAASFYMATTEGDQVADFFKQFFPESSDQIDEWSTKIDDVFTMHIPNAFIFMANMGIMAFNGIVKGAETMVNGVITGINALIGAFNKVAKFLHLPTIGTIPLANFSGVQIEQLGYLGSRNFGGTNNNGGGNGGQAAPFAQVTRANGAGGGAGGGTSQTININITGDVSGEELINKVKDSLKQGLQDRGFTGH